MSLHKDVLYRAVNLVLPIILALLVAGVVLRLGDKSPVQAYQVLVAGAFGNSSAVLRTLAKATPLIFTGLSVAICARCGFFNMGGEGQLIVGALATTLVGISCEGLPAIVHIPLALAAGAAAGALWCTIAGALKMQFGANEVISTLMLNFIAALLGEYLVDIPLRAPGQDVPRSEFVAASAQIPYVGPGSRFSIAFALAILCCLLGYYLLWHTPLGLEMRVGGLNRRAARVIGISERRNNLIASGIGGAMAGLGGACEILAVHRYFIANFSGGCGFTGIAVGMLARIHPIAVIPSAILFGALQSGGMALDLTSPIPIDFVVLIQGCIMFFIAIPNLIGVLGMRRVAVAKLVKASLKRTGEPRQ